MNEDNENAKTPEESALPGKFKSVDALARAYSELEAEFTRRSQKLKAYEEAAGAAEREKSEKSEKADKIGKDEKDGSEALFRAVTENAEVRMRVVNDYLKSLGGVPLMGAAGAGVTAPLKRPASIAEAGKLALDYFRDNRK